MSRNPLKLRSSHKLIRPRSHRATYRPTLELLENRQLLSTNVLSYHNNLSRTGANLTETTLTPANVSDPGSFGKLFDYPVDGQVYAQPLYMANVTLPDGSVHNIVFVATEHDSVYAFDANDSTAGPDGNGILWQVSFISPDNNTTTVTSGDVNCGVIAPEIGITATPVIDASTGIMYVEDTFKDITDPNNPVYHQQLHALDITTGNDVIPPVEIQAADLGTGDGGNIVRFDPLAQLERDGLVLTNGILYTTWTSHCDHHSHGWVIAYDSQTLQQVLVFNTSPNANLATIWAGAPAVDANGNLIFVTGNGGTEGGEFNPNLGDYPETVVKLSTITGQGTVADYFTPFNWDALDKADKDFGSGQVMLLPDQAGPNQHLLVVAGKEGKIYLINRDNMGKFHDGYDDVVQEIPGAIHALGAYDTPTYFDAGASNQRWIYYAGWGDSLRAFQLYDTGTLSTSSTSNSANIFGSSHGATPSLSANGTKNGIVWAIDPNPAGAVLYAYDALNVGSELYNSNRSNQDMLAGGVKFTVPTIADGEVFVGTTDTLSVFGLLGPSSRGGIGSISSTSAAFLLVGENLGHSLVQDRGGEIQAVNSSPGGTTGAAVALPDQGVGVPSSQSLGSVTAVTGQALHHADASSANGADALFGTTNWTGDLG
jgi:hypothetical protein